VSQLRRRQQELDRLGVQVAIVSFEAGPLARAYAQETKLEWPLLVDENRELYHAYGMLEASAWDVWGPSTLIAYARELIRGNRLREAHGDVRQRGGDVLVDPQGIVRLHAVGDGPADRLPVEAILAPVAG
jgi:peroxiredoxin